jgi:ribokinase
LSTGKTKVCVIGSVNMDLVARAPRLPVPGETIIGQRFDTYPGGKGANQAVSAARMGAEVRLIGTHGDDDYGRRLREILRGENVDISALRTHDQSKTGVGIILVSNSGENVIVVISGANAKIDASHVQASADVIRDSDVLLMQLETTIEAVREGATIARSAGKPVLLNAAPAGGAPPDLLKMIDVLIVNKTEAVTLSGMDHNTDPARLALRLADMGPPTVVLTLGAQGSIIAHKGRPRRIPTLAVKSIDSVGAGDCFAGALAAAWGEVHQAGRARSPDEFRMVEDAMLAASAAGALSTLKPGAIPSLPTREDVLRELPGLIKKFRI